MWYGRFAYCMQAHHVGAVHGQQFIFRGVAHGAHHAYSRIVDHGIDAPLFRYDGRYGGIYCSGLGHIEGDAPWFSREGEAGFGAASCAPNAVSCFGKNACDG